MIDATALWRARTYVVRVLCPAYRRTKHTSYSILPKSVCYVSLLFEQREYRKNRFILPIFRLNGFSCASETFTGARERTNTRINERVLGCNEIGVFVCVCVCTIYELVRVCSCARV